MVVPLFVPGALELVVLFLIVILLFGVPIALVAGFVILTRARRGDAVTQEDVAELREEVAEMRSALEEVREEKRQE